MVRVALIEFTVFISVSDTFAQIPVSGHGRKRKISWLARANSDAGLAGRPTSGSPGGGPSSAASCSGGPCGGRLRRAEDSDDP